MPSIPRRMISTWITQKTANAIALWPVTSAQPDVRVVISVSSASRADPRLDPEPSARHERARHRGDVRAADAEARPHEHRERDAVLRPRVRVEQDRDQHD